MTYLLDYSLISDEQLLAGRAIRSGPKGDATLALPETNSAWLLLGFAYYDI
jgi:hypothetical protein